MCAKKKIIFENQPSLFDWDNIDRNDFLVRRMDEERAEAAAKEAEERELHRERIETLRAAGIGGAYTDLDTSEEEERELAEREASKLFYVSLGSGSSGNSCYLGTEREGIVIDAGIRADRIQDLLEANGIPISRVKALLLTHDHSDHVRYSYNLLRNNRHISLYCTPRVLNGLLRRHSISKRIKEYHTPIFKEIPFKIGSLRSPPSRCPTTVATIWDFRSTSKDADL